MTSNPRRGNNAHPFSLWVAMMLVAGAAVGVWLILPELRQAGVNDNQIGLQFDGVLLAWVFVLGGLSLIGPPLLLLTAQRKPWGAGRLLWFAGGTSAWLLWPPIVVQRVAGDARFRDSMSGTCFYYGTPLMAVYVTCALLAGGHLRRSRRRRLLRSWQETLGLLLGMAWACTGLFLISQFYRNDLFRN